MKVPVADYPSPVPLYKFGEPRILTGLPFGTDHLRWTMEILGDRDSEMEMRRRHPEWNGHHVLRAQPYPFARLLAKIAYGYVVAEWGLAGFNPLGLDIILGRSDDYFYTVGGSWDIAEPIPGGDHITDIVLQVLSPKVLQIRVNIRLFSRVRMPSYTVVVGNIDLQNPQHLITLAKQRADGKVPDMVIRAVDNIAPENPQKRIAMSAARVREIAIENFSNALEILQLIEVMQQQNRNRINGNLSEAGAARAAMVVRNALIARITLLVAGAFSPTREGDKHLRKAFELLERPDVRAEVEKSGSKDALRDAIKLWQDINQHDQVPIVKHFRDKYTAHSAKPKQDIPIPTYNEFFELARATTAVMEKLAHATGGTSETLEELLDEMAVSAQAFWEPWEFSRKDWTSLG